MKVSVSLPGEDVQFLDSYAKEQGLDSRSAALHRAIRLLRTAEERAQRLGMATLARSAQHTIASQLAYLRQWAEAMAQLRPRLVLR